jgi:putative transposase
MTTRKSLVKSHSELTVERQCELLELNLSTFYYKPVEKSPEQLVRDEAMRNALDKWHTAMPYLGCRKLVTKLLEDGLKTHRKEVKKFMNEMGIFIVGWELSDTLDTAPVLQAVQKAIEKHGSPGILNSDQGSQFTSEDYIKLLKTQGIRQSMDGKARWIDNVIIERWFRSLKHDDIYINEYNTPKKLRAGIKSYISDYNRLRPHQSHNNATPEAIFYGKFAAAAA